MSDNVNRPGYTGLQFNPQLFEPQVHTNVTQRVIIITEDKMMLFLYEHEKLIKGKNDWLTPFGLAVTLLTTLFATSFNDFLGIEAEVWKAIFLVGFFASSGWLIYGLFHVYKLRNKGGVVSLIEKLKNSSHYEIL